MYCRDFFLQALSKSYILCMLGNITRVHTVSQFPPKTRCSIKNVARIKTNLNEVSQPASENNFFVIIDFLSCVKIIAHLIKYWLRNQPLKGASVSLP